MESHLIRLVPLDRLEPCGPSCGSELTSGQGPIASLVVSGECPYIRFLPQNEEVNVVHGAVLVPVVESDQEPAWGPSDDQRRRGRWSLREGSIVVPDSDHQQATDARLRTHSSQGLVNLWVAQ